MWSLSIKIKVGWRIKKGHWKSKIKPRKYFDLCLLRTWPYRKIMILISTHCLFYVWNCMKLRTQYSVLLSNNEYTPEVIQNNSGIVTSFEWKEHPTKLRLKRIRRTECLTHRRRGNEFPWKIHVGVCNITCFTDNTLFREIEAISYSGHNFSWLK